MKNGVIPLLALGAYLMCAGLAGYAANPAGAKTALFSGGGFGGLCVVWGLLLAAGLRWARWAGLATMGLLAAAFTWRATAGWLAVADGNADKIFAASLITSMLVATGIAAAFLWRSRR